jgi:putative transposase
MKKSTDLRHGRSCVFAMHVHLVFVTKYRREVFTQQVMRELHLIFASVCNDFEAALLVLAGVLPFRLFGNILKVSNR